MTVQWRHVPSRANGQPAVGCYIRNDETGRCGAMVIDVLMRRDDKIAVVTAFIDNKLLKRFGLPAVVPA